MSLCFVLSRAFRFQDFLLSFSFFTEKRNRSKNIFSAHFNIAFFCSAHMNSKQTMFKKTFPRSTISMLFTCCLGESYESNDCCLIRAFTFEIQILFLLIKKQNILFKPYYDNETKRSVLNFHFSFGLIKYNFAEWKFCRYSRPNRSNSTHPRPTAAQTYCLRGVSCSRKMKKGLELIQAPVLESVLEEPMIKVADVTHAWIHVVTSTREW